MEKKLFLYDEIGNQILFAEVCETNTFRIRLDITNERNTMNFF